MHNDIANMTEGEDYEVASQVPTVVLSYHYNGSQFRVRAEGGDVNAREHALDGAYHALRGFSTKFSEYMRPKCGVDAREDESLLCAMRQSGGPTPEITIAFRLDPALGRSERNNVVDEMSRYVSQAIGAPLNTGIRQV